MSQREVKQQEVKQKDTEKLPFPPITAQDIVSLRQNHNHNHNNTYAQSILSAFSQPESLAGIVSEMDLIAILSTLAENDV